MPMKKQQDIFQRYEKKYVLSPGQYGAFWDMAAPHITVDEYGETDILSLYMDTPDRRLIRTSLEKPVYKEKLRLRSYGIARAGSTVFLELKKKYKGIVYKRRVALKLEEARAYLLEGHPVSQPCQITREIDWFLKYYENILPSMHISCKRIACYGLEDSNLRVTFDRDICYRETHLFPDSGAWGEVLLQPGQRLMELKIPNAMPLWLSSILSDLEIYPQSFSKYGQGFLQAQQNNRGGVICA